MKDLGSIRVVSPHSSKVVIYGHCLIVIVPSNNWWSVKTTSAAAHLYANSSYGSSVAWGIVYPSPVHPSTSHPIPWELGPRQYLSDYNSALNKSNLTPAKRLGNFQNVFYLLFLFMKLEPGGSPSICWCAHRSIKTSNTPTVGEKERFSSIFRTSSLF